MSVVRWFRDAATHWVTAIAGVFIFLSTVWHPAAALGATLWSNLGTLLPILATMQSRIAPNIDWLPAGTLNALLFVVAVLYVVKLGDKVIDAYQNRL